MTGRPLPGLQFVKLGGSLITDKMRPQTARLEVIEQMAVEIASARRDHPGLKLLLGHGSGSFGHTSARQYGTRHGVHTPEQWVGFSQVWKDAQSLNRLVIDALHAAGLPAIALPASAALTVRAGSVTAWNLGPLVAALEHGLLPVIYGDVVFDEVRGGTIFSTEDLFSHLALQLHPARILLAGLEAGVWADFPACTQLIDRITPGSLETIAPALSGSAATDVTGGMRSKVRESLALVEQIPGLEVMIFSALEAGALKRAILGETLGSLICAR